MAANRGNPEGQDARLSQALPLACELFPWMVEKENQSVAERIVFRRLKPRLGHYASPKGLVPLPCWRPSLRSGRLSAHGNAKAGELSLPGFRLGVAKLATR